jgi:5-methylcytosine-specific restriction endonuclease McrA
MALAHVCSKCGAILSAETRGTCNACKRPQRPGSSRPELDRFAWQKLRRAARLRDGNRCVSCGAIERLAVHHAVEGSQLLDDLVTLCSRCHRREHTRRTALQEGSFFKRVDGHAQRQGGANFVQRRGMHRAESARPLDGQRAPSRSSAWDLRGFPIRRPHVLAGARGGGG